MSDSTPTLIGSLRTLLPLLTRQDRMRTVRLLILSFFAALSELGLAGGVALLATFFATPEKAFMQLPAFIKDHATFLEQDPRYGIVAAFCLVICLLVVKNALATVNAWLSTNLAEGISNTTSLRIMQFFCRVPYLWVSHTGTAEMLYTFSAARQLGNTLINLIQIINHLIIVLLFFVGLLVIAPLPSLLVFFLFALSTQCIIKVLRKAIDVRASAVYRADHESYSLQQLGIHALKELRLYGRTETLSSQYGQALMRAQNAKSRQSMFSRLPINALETLGFCILLLMLLFLVWVQDASIARITAIMGFMAAAAWRLLPVGNRLLEYWVGLRGNAPYLHRAAQAIQEEANLAGSLMEMKAGGTTVPLPYSQAVQVAQASFGYPGAPSLALDCVTFSIPRGSMVGIVGLSGAGKSTLINILAGLIPPTSGNILIDGTPLELQNTPAWLAKIGYVSQAPYILNLSLAENIALSTWGEKPDPARVLECCHMAALDFVNDLPDGIDTILGERGTRLSGGQAQRVAIARALYSHPELVIFDEATSSLDMKNERAIHETILSLRKQMTLVIIAHRLSAVEGCDQLVWLDKGQVRACGPTKEILPEYSAFLHQHEPEAFQAE
ncbi:ABC transporter ATP-binding protein [Desulfovibrio cuneatus]|uniref:ABC transporter ATP-binding protein n=1 Tax=Desulfovibrio cuneatus TaxID=159728 RepID=UPI0004016A1B|nr:ABC transporter ATP-binding protein [Desulfovibrio cuneatus]